MFFLALNEWQGGFQKVLQGEQSWSEVLFTCEIKTSIAYLSKIYIYIYIYMFELQYVLSFCLDPEKTEENRRKTSFITKNKLKTLKSFSLSWAVSSFAAIWITKRQNFNFSFSLGFLATKQELFHYGKIVILSNANVQVVKAGGKKWKSMTDAVRSPISLPLQSRKSYKF